MDTKTDRRTRRREKEKHAPVGTPTSKVRATTPEEVKAHLRKIREKKKK